MQAPSHTVRTLALALLVALAAAAASQAQTTIDQAKALVGNVTPGNTSGVPVNISQPGS